MKGDLAINGRTWSSLVGLGCLGVGAALAADPTAARPPQYVSRVQMVVHELSPELLRRSQGLVRDEFTSSLAGVPQFKGHPHEIRTIGNEVVLSLVSAEDVREPMQVAVANMIEHLNGRVHTRGQSLFYKTSLMPTSGGYLEVVVDDTQSKIRSIAAQSVPLRDLLKEVRIQMGALSYLIPGECAERLVDFSFGVDDGAQPKTVDALMGDLATLFGLRYEKRNGTYIFSGSCSEDSAMAVRGRRINPSVRDKMRAGFMPTSTNGGSPLMPQVFFPLSPLE